MNRFPVPSTKELVRIAPWLGGGLLIFVALLTIGLKASEIASARSDFTSAVQRLLDDLGGLGVFAEDGAERLAHGRFLGGGVMRASLSSTSRSATR